MSILNKVATTFIAGSLVFSGAASTLELRLGTITPDNTIWAKQLKGFVAKVAELSDGDLTIEYFGNAQLGTMSDTMKMVLTGRLDMWIDATPVLAAVTPELGLLTFPYVLDGSAEASCAISAARRLVRSFSISVPW